jgi:glycosyltransferase involved in cell wall biosynthesis
MVSLTLWPKLERGFGRGRRVLTFRDGRSRGNILFIESGAIFGYSGFTQQFLMEAKAIRSANLKILVLAFASLRDILRKKSHMYKEVLEGNGITYLIIPSWLRENIVIEKVFGLLNTIILGLVVIFTGTGIIHAHDLTAAYYAIRLKRLLRVKVIFDMHGIAIEEKVYSNQLKENSFWHKRMTGIERYVTTKADFIFCVSSRMREYVAMKHGINELKFVITPTNVDTDLFSYFEDQRKEARNRLGLDEKFVVTFMGHVKSWQVNSVLVGFLRALKERIRNTHFLIITDRRGIFEDIFQQSGIEGESYCIYSLKHDEVRHYAIAGDIGILLRDDSIVNRVAAPAKFGEYLALGLPVVVTRGIGDTEDIINRYKVGVVLGGTDEESINRCVEEISTLLNGKRSELSERCWGVANRVLSKEICLEKFMAVYELCWNDDGSVVVYQ